jgi:hypothetical protein
MEGRSHTIVVSCHTIGIPTIGGRVAHGWGGVWHRNADIDSGYLLSWVNIWLPDSWWTPVAVEAMTNRPVIRVRGGGGI